MKKYALPLILLLFAGLSTYIIASFNGTGGGGDSILHFLFAKYAPKHPELYFNHWAKPLFTLLSSPFAQLGFTGIKIFNAVISLATLYFTCKIAETLQLKNALLAAIMLITSPLFLLLTFSGLTEPLFALFVAMGSFFATKKQLLLAAIIVSFLPFVRSEGLIIAGVFALYFLIKKQWKPLPFLLLGHLIYSIAGYFTYHDFLWVFTKIPYSNMNENYGSGNLNHFAVQLMFVVGVPIYALFWVGSLVVLWKSITKKTSLETTFFIGISFFTFFLAHTLFWYFGLFNSMGLKRVFIGVAPLIALAALIGYNFIVEELLADKRIPKQFLQRFLILYILIFPFTSNPAALKWNKSLSISKTQECALEIRDYFNSHSEQKKRFIFIDPYLSEALQIDHFDPQERIELNAGNLKVLHTGDIVIWDNWFALIERGITKQTLLNDLRLTLLFESNTYDNREVEYLIFEAK